MNKRRAFSSFQAPNYIAAHESILKSRGGCTPWMKNRVGLIFSAPWSNAILSPEFDFIWFKNASAKTQQIHSCKTPTSPKTT